MRNYFKIVLFLLLAFLGQEVLAKVAKITDARLSVSSDKVRLVLEASSTFKYKANVSGKKITVDMKGASLSCSLKKLKLAKTPISSISSKKNGNNFKIIISLNKEVDLKHFALSKPERLVLDLHPKAKSVAKKGWGK